MVWDLIIFPMIIHYTFVSQDDSQYNDFIDLEKLITWILFLFLFYYGTSKKIYGILVQLHLYIAQNWLIPSIYSDFTVAL